MPPAPRAARVPLPTPPCPLCGQPLAPVALDGQTPPWLCATDSRGFWPSELEAAALLDPVRRDFGRVSRAVVAAARGDADAARIRGTGVGPDLLPYLDDEQLANLASRKLAAGFAAQVGAESKARRGQP